MENACIVTFCVVYTTLFESFEALPTGMCEGTNGTSCCSGYKWDPIQEKCISCGKGKTGSNCEVKCPFPAYGVGCQMICNCIVKECDSVNGCKRSTTEFPITSSFGLDNKMVTTKLLESTVSFSENNPMSSSTNIQLKTATTEFLRSENNTYYPDNTPQNDGKTTCKAWNQERKQNNSLTFALIGLLIVSATIAFAYIYTRLLEKRFIVTRIV